MIATTNEDAEKDRKRIRIFQLLYLVLWLSLWCTQRTAEAMSIEGKRKTKQYKVERPIRYTLFISNIMELLIELALYATLLKVSLGFSKFLSSYEKTYSKDTEEYRTIKQGRTVFLVVTITIVLLMISNSLYSATSPYLWLRDVYADNTDIENLFSAATTLFYATNTFCACLMLYVNYYFYLGTQ